MLDNEIFKVLVPLFPAGFTLMWAQTIEAAQSYQPQAEGVAGIALPVVTLQKIPGDKRYGFLERIDAPDPDEPGGMIHTETQIYESTFQATAIFKQTPDDVDGCTAADIANRAAQVVQSDWGRDQLRQAGIGVLRVTTIRNTWFVDGSDQHEASPSFDFTLTHKQVTVTKIGAVGPIELRDYPI